LRRACAIDSVRVAVVEPPAAARVLGEERAIRST
jgi:hypothetical protein